MCWTEYKHRPIETRAPSHIYFANPESPSRAHGLLPFGIPLEGREIQVSPADPLLQRDVCGHKPVQDVVLQSALRVTLQDYCGGIRRKFTFPTQQERRSLRCGCLLSRCGVHPTL